MILGMSVGAVTILHVIITLVALGSGLIVVGGMFASNTLPVTTALFLITTAVAKAVQLSGTEAGAIYVFDNRQHKFNLRATYGMDRELIDALTQPIGDPSRWSGTPRSVRDASLGDG